MLSRNGVIVRFVCCFCLYFLSGTEIITGWLAGISGVLGTIALASALLRYSPVDELLTILGFEFELQRPLSDKLRIYRTSHMFKY